MVKAPRSVRAKKRKQKIIKAAKGYIFSRHKKFRAAKDAVIKARGYAFRDRRKKKSAFRKTWERTINVACRQEGILYSRFIPALKKAKIELDRKILAELALKDPKVFKQVVIKAKEAIK